MKRILVTLAALAIASTTAANANAQNPYAPVYDGLYWKAVSVNPYGGFGWTTDQATQGNARAIAIGFCQTDSMLPCEQDDTISVPMTGSIAAWRCGRHVFVGGSKYGPQGADFVVANKTPRRNLVGCKLLGRL